MEEGGVWREVGYAGMLYMDGGGIWKEVGCKRMHHNNSKYWCNQFEELNIVNCKMKMVGVLDGVRGSEWRWGGEKWIDTECLRLDLHL